MRIQDDTTSSDSGRTTLDRQAVTATGQLLMSAIWLEHRVRRLFDASEHVDEPASIRCVFVRTSASHQFGPRVLAPDSRSA
jgi:hypothetical protein